MGLAAVLALKVSCRQSLLQSSYKGTLACDLAVFVPYVVVDPCRHWQLLQIHPFAESSVSDTSTTVEESGTHSCGAHEIATSTELLLLLLLYAMRNICVHAPHLLPCELLFKLPLSALLPMLLQGGPASVSIREYCTLVAVDCIVMGQHT